MSHHHCVQCHIQFQFILLLSNVTSRCGREYDPCGHRNSTFRLHESASSEAVGVVRAVGVVMARELNALGLASRWIEMPPEINRAGHLFASKPGKSKKLLLIGHLDTVFEADDAFQAFTREGNIGQGPGIADMKDGNAVIVYALKALQSIGALDDIAVTVAYTGDEEKTGRPLS